MPALVLCGRRWHTTTDMVCIPAGMGAFFHGIWVIIVAVESAHFQAWRVCPGSGPLFEIALGGLLAVFVLSTVNQVVMTVVSLRGASRPRLAPCMHAPSRPVRSAKLVVLYGTMPVQLWPPPSPARPRVHRRANVPVRNTPQAPRWSCASGAGSRRRCTCRSCCGLRPSASWVRGCCMLVYMYDCAPRTPPRPAPPAAAACRTERGRARSAGDLARRAA